MRHPEVISFLAEVYKPKTYLELGLYKGETFNIMQGRCSRTVGVDINPTPLGGEIYMMTTDKFFEAFTDPVDMVFIDADHSYESVKKDFENSLNLLNDGGVIVLHDTDPEQDFLFHSGYCGDCYKIVQDIEAREDVNVVTLPVHAEGLCIITKKNDTRVLRRK